MEELNLTAAFRRLCPLAGHAARRRGALPCPRLQGAFLFALALLLLPSPSAVHANSRHAGEYQVKAAFILNFTNFIDWPDSSLSSDAFIIGILGRDPFGGAIDSLNGKTAKGRKVVIRRYDDPGEAREADILFISDSEKRALPRILKALRNRPVLTVGDSQGFARSGVMIGMLLHGTRVGFEINNRAAHQAGIRISSRLLRLAGEVIEP